MEISITVISLAGLFVCCDVLICAMLVIKQWQRKLFSEAEPDVDVEPFNTLREAFSSYGDIDPLLFHSINKYLEPISVPAGYVF